MTGLQGPIRRSRSGSCRVALRHEVPPRRPRPRAARDRTPASGDSRRAGRSCTPTGCAPTSSGPVPGTSLGSTTPTRHRPSVLRCSPWSDPASTCSRAYPQQGALALAQPYRLAFEIRGPTGALTIWRRERRGHARALTSDGDLQLACPLLRCPASMRRMSLATAVLVLESEASATPASTATTPSLFPASGRDQPWAPRPHRRGRRAGALGRSELLPAGGGSPDPCAACCWCSAPPGRSAPAGFALQPRRCPDDDPPRTATAARLPAARERLRQPPAPRLACAATGHGVRRHLRVRRRLLQVPRPWWSRRSAASSSSRSKIASPSLPAALVNLEWLVRRLARGRSSAGRAAARVIALFGLASARRSGSSSPIAGSSAAALPRNRLDAGPAAGPTGGTLGGLLLRVSDWLPFESAFDLRTVAYPFVEALANPHFIARAALLAAALAGVRIRPAGPWALGPGRRPGASSDLTTRRSSSPSRPRPSRSGPPRDWLRRGLPPPLPSSPTLLGCAYN